MNAATPLADNSELAAALLQAAITAALALLCAFLYQRYRKPYFAWWSAAWALYVLRLGAIIGFLLTRSEPGSTGTRSSPAGRRSPLLCAALVFSRGLRWRPSYLAARRSSRPLWSYIAIYRLDQFRWAAGPAVALPEPRHALDRLGVLLVSAPGGLHRRRPPGRRLPPVGPAPPRLPVPPGPRRVDARGATTSTSSSRSPWAPASSSWCSTTSGGGSRALSALSGDLQRPRPGARRARRAARAAAHAAGGAGQRAVPAGRAGATLRRGARDVHRLDGAAPAGRGRARSLAQAVARPAGRRSPPTGRTPRGPAGTPSPTPRCCRSSPARRSSAPS